jgi:hypothetical protein
MAGNKRSGSGSTCALQKGFVDLIPFRSRFLILSCECIFTIADIAV